jgi:hypothetical protein
MNTKRTPAVKWAKAHESGEVPDVTRRSRPWATAAGPATRIGPVPDVPALPAENPRALRFEQAIVTIALLAGFVFGIPLVILVVAVVLGAALVAGPKANVLGRAYEKLFPANTRLRRVPVEPASLTRVTRAIEVGLLLVASLFVAFGAHGLAWTFALPVAAITGLAATTGINVVAFVYDRSARR